MVGTSSGAMKNGGPTAKTDGRKRENGQANGDERAKTAMVSYGQTEGSDVSPIQTNQTQFPRDR